MRLRDSSILTNIHVPGNTTQMHRIFEKNYVTICSMVGRMYTDEELSLLPDVNPTHPHYREWQVRKRNMCRLVSRLKARNRPLDILDIGCGNGWLTHHLADIPDTRVRGLDINFTELQQAARVFYDYPNLSFIRGDLLSGLDGAMSFDVIVLADAIQYFPSLRRTLNTLLSKLHPGGEIHILDSPLFKPSEIHRETLRSAAYYASLGFPEMADFHFHHCINDLRSFHYSILYNPAALQNRLLGSKAPFPWVCVKNN